ncbi:MAG: multinuclear nonheme iron-dependent oxidase [Solirubrobacteraceae bacterium]
MYRCSRWESRAWPPVGGGTFRDGRYHDTNTDPVVPGVLELVGELCARRAPAGILLERDDDFSRTDELAAELRSIEAASALGAARRPSVVR